MTRRLIADLFRLRDLGRQTAKGFAEPVEAFVVEGFAVTESRFEAARRGLTDLVGRAAESALLRDRLREAWAGAGQIVLLSGEAGIGKSRLAAQLATEGRERAAHAAAVSMLALSPRQARRVSACSGVSLSCRTSGGGAPGGIVMPMRSCQKTRSPTASAPYRSYAEPPTNKQSCGSTLSSQRASW